MHANHWFLARGKMTFGPYPLERLKQLASSGDLKPDDLVLRDGLQIWEKASNIPGLFRSSVTSPIDPRHSSKKNEKSKVQAAKPSVTLYCVAPPSASTTPEQQAGGSGLLENLNGWHVVGVGVLILVGIGALIQGSRTPQQQHQEFIDSRGKALQREIEAERERQIEELEIRIRAIQEDAKKHPERYR